MISFDMVLYVRHNLSKEDVSDSAKLLDGILRKVGAVGGQDWLPRGLPKTGVRYNGHVRVLDERKIFSVSHFNSERSHGTDFAAAIGG